MSSSVSKDKRRNILLYNAVFRALDALRDTIAGVVRHPSLSRAKSRFRPVHKIALELIRDLKQIEKYLEKALDSQIGDINKVYRIDRDLVGLSLALRASSINQAQVRLARDKLVEHATPPLDPGVDIQFHFNTSGIPRMHEVIWSARSPKRWSYPLVALMEWVEEKSQPVFTSTEIGVLHSVHLYRGRGMLHHEFVLLAYENDAGVRSWVRADRSFGGPKWRASSVALVGRNSELVETVMFSSSIDDLADNCSPVVSITIPPLRDHKSAFARLSSNVLMQLRVVDISPRYTLFSENCRWFARRVMLGIHDIINGLVQPIITWNGQPASLDLISRRAFFVQDVGLRNIPVQNALRRGWELYNDKKHREMHRNASDALGRIKSLSRPSTEVSYLRVVALRQHGLALRELKRFDEAKESLEDALESAKKVTLKNPYPRIEVQDSLASVFFRMGYTPEAQKLWKSVLSNLQNRIPLNPSRSSHSVGGQRASMIRLATILHNYVTDLTKAPGMMEERMKECKRIMKLHEQLDRNRPERFKRNYLVAMIEYAAALKDVGRIRKAFSASKLALTLARAVYEVNRSRHLQYLAITLYNHSTYASNLGKYDLALRLGFEALQYYRYLYTVDASFIKKYYEASNSYATNLRHAGHLREALSAFKETQFVLQKLSRLEPGQHDVALAVILVVIAKLERSERHEGI